MEVPRLGGQLELQLPAYSTAIATPDLSFVCELQHSSQQCQVLNPLSEARDWTCILMDTRWILNPLSHDGNFLFWVFYINGITQHVAFCVWLLSFSMCSNLIHTIACIWASFLLYGWIIFHNMYTPHFIYLFIIFFAALQHVKVPWPRSSYQGSVVTNLMSMRLRVHSLN